MGCEGRGSIVGCEGRGSACGVCGVMLVECVGKKSLCVCLEVLVVGVHVLEGFLST